MLRNQPESIHIRPVPSRYLLSWLGITHLFALVVVWQIQLSLAWKVVISLALLGYLLWQVQLHFMRSIDSAITEAGTGSDGFWQLNLKSGAVVPAELLPGSFVKPWLMVLSFKLTPRSLNKTLILFPDSLDKETARRLRIHLLSNRQRKNDFLPYR